MEEKTDDRPPWPDELSVKLLPAPEETLFLRSISLVHLCLVHSLGK